MPVEIDRDEGIITIAGVGYTFELFAHFALVPPDDRWFRIIKNEAGVVTFETINHPPETNP